MVSLLPVVLTIAAADTGSTTGNRRTVNRMLKHAAGISRTSAALLSTSDSLRRRDAKLLADLLGESEVDLAWRGMALRPTPSGPAHRGGVCVCVCVWLPPSSMTRQPCSRRWRSSARRFKKRG